MEIRSPKPRKGFVDDDGFDRPPCKLCKHHNKLSTEVPCHNCISIEDLRLHKPNSETIFFSFEPIEKGGES